MLLRAMFGLIAVGGLAILAKGEGMPNGEPSYVSCFQPASHAPERTYRKVSH